MCYPYLENPRWAGRPQLQASRQDYVAKLVQGVINRPSLWDVLGDKVDIPECLVGSTLGDSPWRPTHVILGIRSAEGFSAPLVEVVPHICGRNIKALIDCGSTGNYISNSLVLALGKEVVL